MLAVLQDRPRPGRRAPPSDDGRPSLSVHSPHARLVCQAPEDLVARLAPVPAPSAPPVITSDTARRHRMGLHNAMACHLQSQAAKAGEYAQIEANNDNIGHIETFQMDGLGISIVDKQRSLHRRDARSLATRPTPSKAKKPKNTSTDLRGLNATTINNTTISRATSFNRNQKCASPTTAKTTRSGRPCAGS